MLIDEEFAEATSIQFQIVLSLIAADLLKLLSSPHPLLFIMKPLLYQGSSSFCERLLTRTSDKS